MTDRREFTKAWVAALLGGATITVHEACGGGGGPSGPSGGGNYPPGTPSPEPTPSPTAEVTDEVGAISGNHGHRAVITGAQLTEGQELTLDISFEAGHGHNISLTADEVVAVRDGQTVTKQTTQTNAHRHNITFN